MGAEVRPEDRMTCAEIRYKYKHRGVKPNILAQLNACDIRTIQKILSDESYDWGIRNRPKSKKNSRSACSYVVVNADEGRFYPSLREAETQEGIHHTLLSYRFKRDGPRTVINGVEYHLYKVKKGAHNG